MKADARASITGPRGNMMSRQRRWSPGRLGIEVRKLVQRMHWIGSDQTGNWEVTYSSFAILLLAFFIMLSSFATVEEAKVSQFVRSFNTAMSILSGGVKFDKGEEILRASPDIVEKSDILPRLHDIVRQLDLDDAVSVSISPRGLVMRMSERLLFNCGVASISLDALPLLTQIGDVVMKTDMPIRIEGHTDNVPITTAQFPSNWELSTARAVNVLRYFIEHMDIPADRLSAVGHSEFQPLAPNDTAKHRAMNRRVEIVFVGAAEEYSSKEVNDEAQETRPARH